MNDFELTPSQLQPLRHWFHQGAKEASSAFSKWTGKRCMICVEALDQMPLADAAGKLSLEGEAICFCALQVSGLFSGQLIFGFDDASGLALADLLLNQAIGTSTDWHEMATSAALETTNIIGCAFLNALAKELPKVDDSSALLPSPPSFARDFPESFLEFALVEQAMVSNHVLLASTVFHIDESPVNWNLLYIPGLEFMRQLQKTFPREECSNGGPKL